MATLARNKANLDVCILVRSDADATVISEQHVNRKYLPDPSTPGVRATTDPAVRYPTPTSSSTRSPCSRPGVLETVRDSSTRRRRPVPPKDLGGFVRDESEVIPAGLGRDQPLAVLSGPTFAVEIMRGLPTAIVAASEDKTLALSVQRLFASSCLRVNTSNDVVGVEMSGALKNVLAIAAGIVDGLELGNNALAAVVAQGCAEIRWLAQRMGASPRRCGLSGTGILSRVSCR